MRENVLATSYAPAAPEFFEDKTFHVSNRTPLCDPKVQSQRLHHRLSRFYESMNPDRLGNVPAIVKLFEGKSAVLMVAS